MVVRSFIFSLLAILLLYGCGAVPGRTEAPWLTPDWLTSEPSAQGVDQEKLELLLEHIDESRMNLHSLLIIRNGKIILEKYYPGHSESELHPLYSVTKSFVSTLFGIAYDQQKLAGVDLKVVPIFSDRDFDNLDHRKESIALGDLLTMSSGLEWTEGDSTYISMYNSPDWIKYVMDLPMAEEPGKTFRYCSGCSHVILQAIELATGMDGVEYAKKYLFDAMEIANFQWERTPQGDPIGGWGLSLSTRDMAKLGYLYLRRGVRKGKQVVSQKWIDESTRNRVSTDGKLGYGYQWWTYPSNGAYAALGRYGQTIFVIPALDIVVVTTAQIDDHEPIFDLIDTYVIPSVKK